MPRGGVRAGAGRPKGTGRSQKHELGKTAAALGHGAAHPGLTPREYLTRMMSDPAVDPAVRIRCAALLLPYTEARLADRERGQTELAQQAAEVLPHPESTWANLLAQPEAAVPKEAEPPSGGTSWDVLLGENGGPKRRH